MPVELKGFAVQSVEHFGRLSGMQLTAELDVEVLVSWRAVIG